MLALDPQSRRDFWEGLFALTARGTTILVSTHYMDEAERCHALAILDQGRVVASGSPEQLMANLPLQVVEIETRDPAAARAALRGLDSLRSLAQLGLRLHALLAPCDGDGDGDSDSDHDGDSDDDDSDDDEEDDDDDDDDRSARELDVRGTVSLLNGVCPTISFTVGSAMVKTGATTKFKETACASIKNGDRVEVEGVRRSDGTVLAKDVKVERVRAEVKGTLSLLGGACPAISFTVGTAKVTTAAKTTFKGGNCVALKNGDRVEVEGFRQTDGTVLAKDVKAVKTEPPVSEITGRVSLLSGTCPAMSFTVGTRRVTTGAATRFKDGACAALKNGNRVEVKGTLQSDGTLLATVVEID